MMKQLTKRLTSPLGLLTVSALVIAGIALVRPGVAKKPLWHKAPEVASVAPPPKAPTFERREPEPLTDALRTKGFHECNPHDPIGLGPYAPYRKLRMGRIAIPQKGGHTDDFGYDVLIHFHGHEPVRKTLVQVAHGITYVGIDRGVGSGPYTKAFEDPKRFPRLLASIEKQLQAYSKHPSAHVRHLAISAWSAGYGAVNRILKNHADRVDAVVLLDGLHGGWKPGAAHHTKPTDVDPAFVQPIFDYATQAKSGRGIFYLTHSQVEPEGGYPSVKLTTALLLEQLGLSLKKRDPGDDPFGLLGEVHSGNLHVLSYAGHREYAHCSHISHITGALRLLESTWKTPALDRSVENTPAPKLGTPAAEGEDTDETDGEDDGAEDDGAEDDGAEDTPGAGDSDDDAPSGEADHTAPGKAEPTPSKAPEADGAQPGTAKPAATGAAKPAATGAAKPAAAGKAPAASPAKPAPAAT
ncbi:MAG: hypothetical protein KC766_24155 [Myxococcales bacterium]|nr:hypothetical protein [Myxococcales bacterium]